MLEKRGAGFFVALIVFVATLGSGAGPTSATSNLQERSLSGCAVTVEPSLECSPPGHVCPPCTLIAPAQPRDALD